MRIKWIFSISLLLHFNISDAQICFSDNAINYSSRTGVNFMKDIAAGLINNDTLPDVAFARNDKIYCRYGDGTGLFTPGVLLPFNGNVLQVEIADMDNDGYDDIVAVELYNKIHILFNDGSGTFADSVYTAPSAFGGTVKLFLEDVNNDNIRDMVFPAYGNGIVTTFVSNGLRQYSSGSFTVPFNISAAAIGNFDPDNFIDLVLVNGINYIPYHGNGTGFTAGSPVAKLSQMETIGISDMNNDGVPDIIYTMAQSMSVDYFNNSGAIASTATINLQGEFISHYVNADDMLIFDSNNDNFPEVILPSEYNYSLGVLNNTSGNLVFTQYVATMGCLAASVADFDMDGLKDVVTMSGNIADYFSVFRNESGGIFKGDVYLNANFHQNIIAPALNAVDVNHDGYIDLLTHGGDSLNVIMNDGTGAFSASGSFFVSGTTILGSSPLASADFNNDGDIDVVLSNSAQDMVLMAGDGGGNFLPPVVIPATGLSFPHIVITGKFNGDSYPDIAYCKNSEIGILLNNGSGVFTLSGNIPSGGNSYGITANDFNGDGIDDIAFTLSQTGGSLYINNGSGSFTFGDGYISCAAGDLNGIASGDINSDGYMDIAITDRDCQYPHRVLTFYGDGTGQLNPGGNITVYDSPYYLTIEDINFDGRSDIVTNSLNGLITVALQNNFNFQTFYLASGEISQDVLAADFNNDSKPDLAYCNNYSVDIGVAINSISKIYPASQLSACTGDSVLLYITDTVQGFEWSTGETNDSIYVVNSGVYSVSVSSPGFGNCFASTKATVTFSNPVPVIFDGTNNPDSICTNQSVNLNASPSGGVFSGPGITDSIFDPASLAPNQSYTLSYDYMNASGCNTHAEFTIFVDACTGLNEAAVLNIKISPNPVNDELVIDQELEIGYKSCEIFNPYGELVLSQQLNNRTEFLNTASLASGMYYLKMTDPSKTYQPVTRRFCVVHY